MALFRREEDGKELELHEDYAVLAEREGFKLVEAKKTAKKPAEDK